MQLNAGEKAHFVLSNDIVWPWEDLGQNNSKKYIKADLSKGDEGFPYALSFAKQNITNIHRAFGSFF